MTEKSLCPASGQQIVNLALAACSLAGCVEMWVRFDDMLATVLARPAERPVDRVAQWRQLLDLLAQRRPGSDPALAREALARLQELRADVPVAIRREIASAFAGRAIPPPLVVFLASDVPVVAGALLAHVRLADRDWLAVLPRLSPTGRGFLRYRRDLGRVVERALAGFGATDLAIGGEVAVATAAASSTSTATVLTPSLPDETVSNDVDPDAEAPSSLDHGSGEGQIRAIISRIARFREGRDHSFAAPDPLHEMAASFRFETGADGMIRWVDGVPRGALIGETIATPATGMFGVDAQAPGAFHRRAPFRDARLVVPGTSSAAGEWRIAGVPVFAADTGRFQGYRGTARRPRGEDRAETIADGGLYGGGFQADSLRQLVHELRTPLNAIGGFAEMIRRQMRGPVSTTYRDRAQSIAEQAGQLLAAVDDLDVAARLDTKQLDLQRVEVDLGAMLATVCDLHAASARRRGAGLACDVTAGLPRVSGDPAALRRMLGRLLAGATALAADGETIRATLWISGRPGMIELTVDRPARLAGLSEAALLDPGFGPEGDWPDAPLLGMGFSLHLVRKLAAAAGGAFEIEPDRFLLRVPAALVTMHGETGG